eukprot:TRINITY_DN8403_c0_g1_i1.p1 TRINITY_DN8403_c0_g1~~TRINITY_DN8403_c0_g1_i1.p1  ORF type:complete len:382 (+),score=86.70 TRINITY_DN8403_c0_g1_i1:14-1159(+)
MKRSVFLNSQAWLHAVDGRQYKGGDGESGSSYTWSLVFSGLSCFMSSKNNFIFFGLETYEDRTQMKIDIEIISKDGRAVGLVLTFDHKHKFIANHTHIKLIRIRPQIGVESNETPDLPPYVQIVFENVILQYYSVSSVDWKESFLLLSRSVEIMMNELNPSGNPKLFDKSLLPIIRTESAHYESRRRKTRTTHKDKQIRNKTNESSKEVTKGSSKANDEVDGRNKEKLISQKRPAENNIPREQNKKSKHIKIDKSEAWLNIIRDKRFTWLSFISQLNSIETPIQTIDIMERENVYLSLFTNCLNSYSSSFIDSVDVLQFQQKIKDELTKTTQCEEEIFKKLYANTPTIQDSEQLMGLLKQNQKEQNFLREIALILELLPQK